VDVGENGGAGRGVGAYQEEQEQKLGKVAHESSGPAIDFFRRDRWTEEFVFSQVSESRPVGSTSCAGVMHLIANCSSCLLDQE
jgi:hypothetical protein